MKNLMSWLIVGLVFTLFSGASARALVIDFEDAPLGTLTTYQGFTFDNWKAFNSDEVSYRQGGEANAAVSGTNAASQLLNLDGTISRDTSFIFEGIHVVPVILGMWIEVTGYLDGVRVGSVEANFYGPYFALPLTTPYFLGANWEVDEIEIGSSRGTIGTIAIDDFTYSELELPPVPLPAGLPLMASAIAVLGLIRRRKAR